MGWPNTIATLISHITAFSIYTNAVFGIMEIIAMIVFEKVGLAILRRAWFDLDNARRIYVT